MSVKYWKLVAQQDTCLAGLDFHLKLVKQSETQLGDARNKLEKVQAQKESQMGALKKEKTGSEKKLRLCERSTEDLVRDIKRKEVNIKEGETELGKVEGELDKMMTKFAKIKAEFTRALAREETLTSERDDLKQSLNLSQNAGTGNFQKARDLEALNKKNVLSINKLVVKNAHSLRRIHELEKNLLETQDLVRKPNDAHNAYTLIDEVQEEPPKNDIIEEPYIKSKESDEAPPLEIKENNYLQGHAEF